MPTKAELEATIDGLKHDVRRLERSLGQAQLDLEELPHRSVHYPRPHRDERSVEAVERGLAEWELNVVDPSKRIDTYIRSMDGIGWNWEKEYVKNRQFAWCGAFAAFCWTSVRFKIRQKIFPSCYRLYSNWAQSSRHIDPSDMMPGDIVVVYSSKRAVQGEHITICRREPVDGSFETVEGNAHGTLGDGSYGEGVIIRERKLTEVAHVYRLLAEDFDE